MVKFTEERVQLGGTELYVPKGGSGSPLLILHGFEGHEGWGALQDALAAHSTVYFPAHPGYTPTERPEWLTGIPHQAVFYHWFIEQQGLGPVDLVGFNIGAWIAAEMAVMCPQNIRRLVLVDAAGLRPAEAEVFDIFITPWQEVIDRCFYDDANCPEYERIYGGDFQEFGGPREAGRTMSMRMCFRPFMYNPALAGMLGKIKLPALIVWGAEDRIMPRECARLYQQGISGSAIEVIDKCGHWPQFERPRELAQIIGKFISG